MGQAQQPAAEAFGDPTLPRLWIGGLKASDVVERAIGYPDPVLLVDSKVKWCLERFAPFDTVSQEWLIKFVEHRVGDRRIIRLIQKWLKAGVLEDGIVTVSDKGTGQARLAAIPHAEERVIVATGRYLGEGFDDSRLDALFFLPCQLLGKAPSLSMPAVCIVSTTPSAR